MIPPLFRDSETVPFFCLYLSGSSLIITQADSSREVSSPQLQASQFDRRVLILLMIVLILRMLYVAIVPLDLAPDEAYYWDWSRQLDWGYYSKPPMVA